MKKFYVTAQCDQSVHEYGWHTVVVRSNDRELALSHFNTLASTSRGWRPASIESVVEAPKFSR